MQPNSKEDFIQELVKIPVLFWKMIDNQVLGLMIGSGYKLIDTDANNIKAQFAVQVRLLHQDYYPAGYRPYCEIVQPELISIQVSVKPFFRNYNQIFPVAEVLNIKLPVVFGKGKFSGYECHLPVFNQEFYCNEKSEINIIAEKLTAEKLHSLDPGNIYSYLLLNEPWLDEVRVMLKATNKIHNAYNPLDEVTFLKEIADLQPPQKAYKQKSNILAEQTWERTEFTEEVIKKIIDDKVNVIVVGEPGVGKTSIITEAVRRINKMPDHKNLTFWRTTPMRIISRAKYLGEWQQLCETMVDELKYINARLWLQDLFSILTTGGSSANDSMAAFMLPFLKDDSFRIVGEMTHKELDSARKLLPGFTEHFRLLYLDEMNKESTLKIFELFNAYTSRNYGISFERDALHLAYRLLNRFVPYEKFPGKAVRFLTVIVNYSMENNVFVINIRQIINAFVQKTGLPEFFLRDDILLDKAALQHHFASRIIGQNEAIEQITSVIKVFKAGINNPEKPVSTMVFAGPTGVGKTAAAKLLADYFFGHGQNQNPLIRFDMSEFQHSGQIDRLIGSTAGHEQGKLIRFVRENPFCVVLFDEIEKANPLIYDVLMTVFDEGTLTDAHGRTTDFRNTIIIMTTNLGSQNRESIGWVNPEKKDFTGPIKNYFRPEFFNRIDHLLVFNPLNNETIRSIAIKELSELNLREGFQKKNIRLGFSDSAVDFITAIGFDKNLGARPLQRAIDRYITVSLAKYFLQNPTIKNCSLFVDCIDNKIVIG